MTHEDKGHFGKKHPSSRKVDTNVAAAVKEKSKNREISCAGAFKVASDTNVSPAEVGFTVDALEISIVKCQLGLFGYRPQKKVVKSAQSVSEKLKTAIGSASREGRLPCSAAWQIAAELGMAKMEVSSACETLGVKIGPCQLGAF